MKTGSIRPGVIGPELRLSRAQALKHKSPNPGPFEESFFGHKGRGANKWTQYLPFYDRVLAPYRSTPVCLLEIGVMDGGSLELWRGYFGADATIFGIDINPKCAGRVDPPNQVRIGSQADPAFLRTVVAEMGGLDIVIDDGSHRPNDQRASFETLWPLLNCGGLYIIEDMHTAYWETWGGGIRRAGTAIEIVKQLIDDMHGRYHLEPELFAPPGDLGTIAITDSIAAIEKALERRPRGHFWVGVDGFA